MNYRVLGLIATLPLALAACSTTGNSVAQQARYTPVQYEHDMAYVHAVESAARKRGVGVYWVHPPRKAVAEPTGG